MFQVAEQQEKQKDAGLPPLQMSPNKKRSYLLAINDFHAAMLTMTQYSLDEAVDGFIQRAMSIYGYQYTCFLADEKDTPSNALKRALIVL